jgi:phosphohistidine phosphatase
MNQFVLIRHAKSSWKFPNLTDLQRPLNKRGCKDGSKIASYITKNGPFIPNLFLVSPAQRTLQTWNYIQKDMSLSTYQFRVIDDLYLCEPKILWDFIQRNLTKNTIPCIIAHNPSIEILVELLVGKEKCIQVTTGNIIYFQYEQTQWKIVDMFRPREPKNSF